ncbi:MAG: carbamoyl-phosphate synthase large subunit [Actinobacteria bacterium]|nr:carbamoyl-phosphate synthase large subunit [Actinomycetota bacterium]
MPKRKDIKKILIIGSGPIVIGQACEFDYSGTQALKALREEGYKLILVNSNPATIMTDPSMADKTYIEPLTPEFLEKVIAKERPDALLPTLGGQTGLNLSVFLAEQGILHKYGVEMIGARLETIKKAEDRLLFKKAMRNIGLEVPPSGYAKSLDEALEILKTIGFPAIIRPSFTLGGSGGGIAFNQEEFEQIVSRGLMESPFHEVLVEKSVLGWKEYELEVMRDKNDNVVIVCSIENFDPMGVHTGDSITVAPAQTLTDVEYQNLRNYAIEIMREIGVETGGSNIQFAVDPETGKVYVIEMNPRVSRSSALASKATGFPIAKFAAKLAVGYTLDEIANDITGKTPASFEPTIDYVVTKIPRFAFEKFPGASNVLGTQMKSVGEVMAIGRTFRESVMKALRSLETDFYGWNDSKTIKDKETVIRMLTTPNPERICYLKTAFRLGLSVEEISEYSKIDPWFIDQLHMIFELEQRMLSEKELTKEILLEAKRNGFSDREIATCFGIEESKVREVRKQYGISTKFKMVDTCAAEFEARTPYFYSTYEKTSDSTPLKNRKVVILGSGPNRIGQGIEFDYICVHASLALKDMGIDSIMINCNPETVSTDYDISSRLYFEPLTLEDVLEVIEYEKPDGVIVQFGGQTPLKLAIPLAKNGVRILGTSPYNIDIAEDRQRFAEIVNKLGLKQAPFGTTTSLEEAIELAERIGYPVLVRPSYVLGGRAMEIVYGKEMLIDYFNRAVEASEEHPVLIDRFLEDALEVDVDAISDGEEVFIAGIMEHVEEAGIHSGDSACVLPPVSLSENTIKEIEDAVKRIALELKVVGFINVQIAIKDGEIYILEANPRASRTVPFVAKAIGLPLPSIATQILLGKKLSDFQLPRKVEPPMVSVKEVVLPFKKFPGVDILLGPEMRSTGEVMGIDRNFALAFAKAQIASGNRLPLSGKVFISVADKDKPKIVELARGFIDLGFKVLATKGTAEFLNKNGMKVDVVMKVREGRPNIVDYIKSGEIQLVINTPFGRETRSDGYYIRTTAVNYMVPCITTLPGAYALLNALRAIKESEFEVFSLQDIHGGTA